MERRRKGESKVQFVKRMLSNEAKRSDAINSKLRISKSELENEKNDEKRKVLRGKIQEVESGKNSLKFTRFEKMTEEEWQAYFEENRKLSNSNTKHYREVWNSLKERVLWHPENRLLLTLDELFPKYVNALLIGNLKYTPPHYLRWLRHNKGEASITRRNDKLVVANKLLAARWGNNVFRVLAYEGKKYLIEHIPSQALFVSSSKSVKKGLGQIPIANFIHDDSQWIMHAAIFMSWVYRMMHGENISIEYAPIESSDEGDLWITCMRCQSYFSEKYTYNDLRSGKKCKCLEGRESNPFFYVDTNHNYEEMEYEAYPAIPLSLDEIVIRKDSIESDFIFFDERTRLVVCESY